MKNLLFILRRNTKCETMAFSPAYHYHEVAEAKVVYNTMSIQFDPNFPMIYKTISHDVPESSFSKPNSELDGKEVSETFLLLGCCPVLTPKACCRHVLTWINQLLMPRVAATPSLATTIRILYWNHVLKCNGSTSLLYAEH